MLQMLKKIMSQTLRISENNIHNEAKMSDIPEWDSLSHMNLIIDIEKEYGIQLSGEDIADMQSIPKIIDAITRNLSR